MELRAGLVSVVVMAGPTSDVVFFYNHFGQPARHEDCPSSGGFFGSLHLATHFSLSLSPSLVSFCLCVFVCMCVGGWLFFGGLGGRGEVARRSPRFSSTQAHRASL